MSRGMLPQTLVITLRSIKPTLTVELYSVVKSRVVQVLFKNKLQLRVAAYERSELNEVLLCLRLTNIFLLLVKVQLAIKGKLICYHYQKIVFGYGFQAHSPLI